MTTSVVMKMVSQAIKQQQIDTVLPLLPDTARAHHARHGRGSQIEPSPTDQDQGELRQGIRALHIVAKRQCNVPAFPIAIARPSRPGFGQAWMSCHSTNAG
jgi:hypothetical protein